MICPHCNTENRPDVRFCRGCGQRLMPQADAVQPDAAVESATAVMPGVALSDSQISGISGQCPHCDQPVKAGARFCAHCGKQLESQAATSSSAPMPMPANQPPPSTPPPQLQPAMPSPQRASESNPPLASPALPPATPVAPPRRRTSEPQRMQKKTLPLWGIGVIIVAGIALIAIVIVLATSSLKPGQVAPTATAAMATATPEPTITPNVVKPVIITSTQQPMLPELPLTIQVSNPSPLTVESKGSMTLTLKNTLTDTLQPQRFDILGTWEPYLAFEPAGEQISDVSREPGELWEHTFDFTAAGVGTSTVQISIKLKLRSQNQIAVLFSDEFKIVVSEAK